MKSAVVFNPTAGKVDQIADLRAALCRWPEAKLMASETPEESQRWVRHEVANGARMVIAAGGDGTVAEVVNALSEDFSRATLGVLPLGTGNDFARSLGLPLDLAGAIAAIERGTTRAIDVIRVSQPNRQRVRHFINIAASGFPSAVNLRVEEQFKSNWGPFGYLAAAAEALPEVTAYEVALFSTMRAHCGDGVSPVVANGRCMASGCRSRPHAQRRVRGRGILTTTAAVGGWRSVLLGTPSARWPSPAICATALRPNPPCPSTLTARIPSAMS